MKNQTRKCPRCLGRGVVKSPTRPTVMKAEGTGSRGRARVDPLWNWRVGERVMADVGLGFEPATITRVSPESIGVKFDGDSVSHTIDDTYWKTSLKKKSSSGQSGFKQCPRCLGYGVVKFSAGP